MSDSDELHQLPRACCFVAGTLVHSEHGLVPIEQVRIGDRVLSRPESGGEISYRPVANTVVHADQQICVLQFMRAGEMVSQSLVSSLNHPFWVDKIGWVAAGELQPGNRLFTHDGVSSKVVLVGKVVRTDTAGVGWACDDSLSGPTIDLRHGSVRVTVAFTEDEINHSALEINKPYLVTVYNIVVEDSHTFFVGDAGIWVHSNT